MLGSETSLNGMAYKAKHARCVFDSADAFGELFKKHLLRLCVDYVVNEKRYVGVYTGFLLRIGNVPLWVSAGHAVEEIKSIQTAQGISHVNFGWADNCGIRDATRIPFRFDSVSSFAFYEGGIDLGFVEIDGLALTAIESESGNEFLDVPAWQPFDKEKVVAHFLIGFPKEAVRPIPELAVFACSQVVTGCFCLPVEKVAFRPDGEPKAFWDEPHAFYGQLKTTTVADVKGMSGGPVFAVTTDENQQMRYHLVAIQSKWIPDSRIIKGTPIEILIEPLVEAHNAAVEKMTEMKK